MDQEQKEMATVGGIAFLLCCCLFVVCFSGGSKKSSTENNPKLKDSYKVATKVEKKTTAKIKHTSYYSRSSSSSSYSSSDFTQISSNNVSKPRISKERIARIKAFKEKAKKAQKESVKKKLQAMLKDSNTSIQTKIKIKLSQNENYRIAYKALLDGDANLAIEYYEQLLKEKNLDNEIKYVALEGLQKCAKITGDLELYLNASKIKGELIATKDLSALNVEKSNSYKNWVEEFSDYMHAKKDKSIKNRLVTALAKKTSRTSKEAERVIDQRIAMYEALFKELKQSWEKILVLRLL